MKCDVLEHDVIKYHMREIKNKRQWNILVVIVVQGLSKRMSELNPR